MSALAPLSAQGESWVRVLTIALEGKSFSDIDRELKAVRRKAALLGEPLDDHLVGLVNGKSGTKNDRIALATELVGAGVLSKRAAHEVTGVAEKPFAPGLPRSLRAK